MRKKRFTTGPRIVINGAFRGQRVTGQQRYATEIADRLLKHSDVIELRPSQRVMDNKILSWIWAILLSMRLRREDLLLTLTSRGPLWRRRHAIVIYDLFPITHPEWYTHLFSSLHSVVLRARARTAILIIADSEPVADQIQRELMPRGEVVVAACAPAKVFSSTPDHDNEVLETYGLEPQHFVLSVASEDPRKNTARLVRAYSQLDAETRGRIELVLVGGRSTHFRAEHVSSENIRRLGYVSDLELAALYRNAAVVAFPSLDEGFGLPAVEAMESGARVLVSDIPVMRWVCGEHASYADPMSTTAIQIKLKETIREEHSVGNKWPSPFSWDESARIILHAARSTMRRGSAK